MNLKSGVRFVKLVFKENGSLRTFLSATGVTIGVFCVVMVMCAVDSLSANIMGSLGSFSSDVLYISRIPFSSDETMEEYQWWEYLKRPEVSYDDYRTLLDHSVMIEPPLYTATLSARVSYKRRSVDGTPKILVSDNSLELLNAKLSSGRTFSDQELHLGANVALVSSELAKNLLGESPPVGKILKVDGRPVEIIGVLNDGASSLISLVDTREGIILPVGFASDGMASITGGMIILRPKDGVSDQMAISEIESLLRGERGLSPREKNNFSINRISYLMNVMERMFDRIALIGNMVGGFSLLIGAFGIANIMFVSVCQRRFSIGVKKALGGRNVVILKEFLLEGVILSVMGGVMAIVILFILTLVINLVLDEFEFYLSLKNVFFGIGVSLVVGIVSGSVPALKAAKTDPVDAMRRR